MSIQFFGRGSNYGGTTISLPIDYRMKVRWLPRIGDIFPDFQTDSTAGRLRFHQWAEGHWVYFASHPEAFSPVSTTELGDIALHAEEFARRRVKPLVLSRDSLPEQKAWAMDVAALFGPKIDFPMISDPYGTLATACGMIHPHQDETLAIRKTLIIDPSLKIRMILEYPMNIGRSIDETLRVIDALQASDSKGLAAPASWLPGDPLLVPGGAEGQPPQTVKGEVVSPRPYLRFIQS